LLHGSSSAASTALSSLIPSAKGAESAKHPTLGDLFLNISGNQGVHQGQFTVVRRKLGKPVLY
jgi:hypothetical protein